MLGQIKSVCSRIEALEKEMVEIAGTATKEETVELIDWIYWDSAYQLDEFAEAMGTTLSNLRKLIPPRDVEVKCRSCKKILIMKAKNITTRDKLLKEKHLCSDCVVKKAKKAELSKLQRKEKSKDGAAKSRVTRWGNGLDLANMPYDQYLLTDYWKKFAHNARQLAGYVCQDCGAGNCMLHVHHLTYERRGCEQYEDVKVVCQSCHSKIHGRQIGNVVNLKGLSVRLRDYSS